MGSFTPNGLYKPDAQEGGAAGLLNNNWDLLDSVVGGGGGGGAPTTASYVTTAAEAGLSAEKVLGTAVIMSGLLSARPAASIGGRLYFATDVAGGSLYRDTGSAWVQIAPAILLTADQDISPAQLTADQNDYNPAGWSTASVMRLDLNANRIITGIAGGYDGAIGFIINTTTTRTLTLPHESASSTAANRFSCPGQQDVQVQPLATAIVWYDSTSSRWRVIGCARQFGGAVATVGTANNSGISPNMARDDHVHQARSHDHSNSVDGQSLAAATTFALTGVISPTQITANQNDYNPTNLSTSAILRLTSDASGRTITGIAGGSSGRMLYLANVGSFNILLSDEDAGSTAANRIDVLTGGGTTTLALQPGGMVGLIYDGTSSRWRAVTLVQYGSISSVGSSNGSGTATAAARADHVHDHGAQTVSTQHAAMVASGGSHAPGFVPDPPSSGGTTKFLREDATWQVPAGGAGGPSVLDRTMADSADYVNSVAETTMYSFSIAGNTLGANGGVRLRVVLDYLNNSAANKTLTLRIKLGATTLWGDTSANLSINANRRVIDIDVILFNTGATNSQRAGGKILMGATNPTTGEGSASATVTINGELYGTAAIDTTAAAVIAVTAIHSAADPAVSLVRKMALLELLP